MQVWKVDHVILLNSAHYCRLQPLSRFQKRQCSRVYVWVSTWLTNDAHKACMSRYDSGDA